MIFMRIRKSFYLALTFLFFLSGCSNFGKPSQPEGVFPTSVGKFSLSNVRVTEKISYLNEKNKKQTYSSWVSTYSDGKDEIYYIAGVHQKPEDAANEQDLSIVFPNDNKNTNIDDNFFLTEPLKDKTGKQVGRIKITREAPLGRNGIGGYLYRIALNINSYTYSLKPSGKNINKDLAEFIKSLPLNSEIDLSVLDKTIESNSNDEITFEELYKISPPVKLSAKPYLKGKIIIVEQKPFNNKSGETFITDETDYYIGDNSLYAKLPSEIGSIIKLDCAKGNRLGDYIDKRTGAKFPIFSSVCKVSVIDNSIPAVIAQRTFVNTSVDLEKKFQGSLEDFEYIAPDSIKITEFIESLPIN